METFLVNVAASSSYLTKDRIFATSKNEAITQAIPDSESFLEFISINPRFILEEQSFDYKVVSIKSNGYKYRKSCFDFDIEMEIRGSATCLTKIQAYSKIDAMQKVRFLFGQAIALVPKDKRILSFDMDSLNVVYKVVNVEYLLPDQYSNYFEIDISIDNTSLKEIDNKNLMSEIQKRQMLITRVYNLNSSEAFYIFNRPYDGSNDMLHNRIAEVLSYR